MSSIRSQRAPAHPAAFRLADLGVYGFDRFETAILAALVTEDPLLLVGRSGTGKTFLLNTLSEALGLEHRHYCGHRECRYESLLPRPLHQRLNWRS